jgi:hypothetical protein
MSASASSERRLGFWSALSVFAIGVTYLLTGIAWLFAGGSKATDPLQPADPYLAILELLILLSALALVTLMVAVHGYAPPARKTWALAALAFMIIFALLTSSIHFVQLTVLRQLQSAKLPVPDVLQFYPWPSTALALDLLAWDLFLGLSLLFAALVFSGGGLQTAVRASLLLGGTLCVAGVLGPGFGQMQLHYLAIFGYAVTLPIACGLLAILFRKEQESG